MKEYIVLYENKYAVIPEDYNKEKLKEFPIEVVAQMAIETMKQDNSFDIEVFQKNKCANKAERGFSWYTSGKSHYAFPNKASLWIKIIEEDLMYFTNVMRYNSKYELPEYFKSKYNKDNKDFKKEDFKIKNNTINSKEDGKQEFKSRENGRSENQLQRENTAKSYYRFAERSKLFGGRYQSSITDENAFSKERTSKNKSVLRNS